MKPLDLLYSHSKNLVIAGLCVVSLVAIHSCKGEEEEPPQPIPVIVESFTPTAGKPGTTVTITGSNFSTAPGGNKVAFNGVSADVNSSTATSITTIVPATAKTGKITVTSDGKIATSTINFIVLEPPVITSFTPTMGPAGTIVTIVGKNFNLIPTNNKVSIGSTSLEVSEPTATSLNVTIPTEARTGKIKIEVNEFSVTSATDFVVTPLITSFTPASGPAGTLVTITGTGFSATVDGNTVKFGTVAATVSEASATSIKVTVPAGAVTGRISVTTEGNTIESRVDFEIN